MAPNAVTDLIATATYEARAVYRTSRLYGWPVSDSLRSAAHSVVVDVSIARRARRTRGDAGQARSAR